MKPLESLMKLICILLCVAPFFSCDTELIILFNEGGKVIPLELSWVTDQQNVTSGGWEITNEGRRIRFDIEDSENCGGNNNKTQSGSATATIITHDTYKFIPDIQGIGEMQNDSYEVMDVSLNGQIIVKSKSPGGGLGCTMGSVQKTELVPPPYILPPGVNTFTITFTTGDSLYQKNAFYELNLLFEEL